MFALRGSAVVLITVAAACTRHEPAVVDTPAPTAAELRRERCSAFAEEAARTARMTGAVLEVALTDRSKWNAQTGQGLAGMGDEVGRAMIEQCMQWPDDVIDCLGVFGALKSGCDEKLAAVLGGGEEDEAKFAADIPAGPAPTWSLALADKPTALAVADDGTVLALVDRQIVGVRGGAVVWRSLAELRSFLIVTAGVAVVADGARVIAVDPVDGSERWSVALPPLPDADEYTGAPWPEIAALAGDGGLWIGDNEARFFRVVPDRCARNTANKPAKGCLVAAGALIDETLDSDARLVIDADGRRALHEFGVVRMFDERWTTTLTARAHDHFGGMTLAPMGLTMVVDDDVVVVDPANCSGEPFAPSGWPQPGQLHIGDECGDCVAAPPGCRRWRMFVEGVASAAPVVAADGAVIVNADAYTRSLRDGAEVWRTVTAGGGKLLRVGDGVIGVSTGLAEEDPLALFELDIADGEHRWRTQLAVTTEGSMYFSDDVLLAYGGGWIVAGYRENIAAVQRPLQE